MILLNEKAPTHFRNKLLTLIDPHSNSNCLQVERFSNMLL